MITGINEPKTLTKHISCNCKCKFDEKKCNSGQWCVWNPCLKSCVWNPVTCSCENGKYLPSIMDDSAITCDEIIESY